MLKHGSNEKCYIVKNDPGLNNDYDENDYDD